MPTYKNLTDEARSNAQSGISADDSRLDDLYLEQKLNTTRAATIAKYMGAGARPNPQWIQWVDISAVDRDVDCKVVSFECPSPIFINGKSDGFIYVGHANGLKPFIRLSKGRVTLAMHSVIKNSDEIYWDYETGLQGNEVLKIYNNPALEFIKVGIIANDPRLVPGFRQDTDSFPVDSSLHNEIIQRITQELLGVERMPQDRISDGQDRPTV